MVHRIESAFRWCRLGAALAWCFFAVATCGVGTACDGDDEVQGGARSAHDGSGSHPTLCAPAGAAMDPQSACSQYTANCVSFEPTRVPTHPEI
jgi:hypothetical protein